tara:strand:+ start:1944 stop:2435 length:492 start_codon:yes stop_codon:yes gene_type:complete
LKTIILFRHGKSNWNALYKSDHERPIAKRGIKAARKIGQYIYDKKNIPDLVICSSAVRARQTAELAISAGNWGSPLVIEKKLYGADSASLIKILKEQKDKNNSICITGHEPTMSSFINRYSNGGIVKFPTATISRIDYNIDTWCNIDYYIGKFCWIIRPKELK